MMRERISDCFIGGCSPSSQSNVGTDIKFSRLGLDSAIVVYVMMEIVENLDLELAVDDFYDHPTVDGLSRSLGEERRPAA